MTLRMRLLIGLAATALAATAQAQPYHAPRTPWGAPDLQGLWTNASQTGLERPEPFKALVPTPAEVDAFEHQRAAASAERAAPVAADAPAPGASDDDVGESEWREWGDRLARIGGQPRTSWIVDPADGKLPYTPAGAAALKAIEAADDKDFAGPDSRPIDERCLMGVGDPAGPPMLNATYNANYQIVQTPDAVAILVEMNHDVRIIPLERKRHGPASLRRWMGDSVGHWEGETLVVETTHLNPAQSGAFNRGGRIVLSDQAVVTERFARTGENDILYAFTVADPVNYTRTWRAQVAMRATPGPLYEYACHEGNYALGDILAGARHAEAQPKGGPGQP